MSVLDVTEGRGYIAKIEQHIVLLMVKAFASACMYQVVPFYAKDMLQCSCSTFYLRRTL